MSKFIWTTDSAVKQFRSEGFRIGIRELRKIAHSFGLVSEINGHLRCIFGVKHMDVMRAELKRRSA